MKKGGSGPALSVKTEQLASEMVVAHQEDPLSYTFLAPPPFAELADSFGENYSIWRIGDFEFAASAARVSRPRVWDEVLPPPGAGSSWADAGGAALLPKGWGRP